MGKTDDQDPAHRAPATEVVHLGRDPFAHHGFVNPPVYRGSTVLYPTLESLEAKTQPYTYGRRGTPTVTALQDALTALAGGAATKLTASGYQAVTTALLAFAEAGDHILVADTVYEPTRQFCDYLLRRLGVETQYYDPLIGAGIAALFRPNTRLVYVESPGSQTFEMQDLPAIAEAAHAKDIWVLADNTWSSPLYCQPLALGADVVIEAGTKYLVGHADALLGFITSNARAAKHIERAAGTLGVCPGSEETFLGLRGLRTLDVRLARHQETGLLLAEWLRARPEVARVLHPGLSSDPGHALWKRDHKGATGLFSIILKPIQKPALAAFLNGLKLFGMGYSWGGYESLVIPFDCTSYRTATRWQPEGPALRFHAGLENVSDLIADLDEGFARLRAAS
ncbi:MAG: cystathionine beta-lyase [Hyphomicrobium sp.]|nr:cystathionine beta-lyase [Hyphomicrobium sp.]PPD06171.1 MAG: cystathionine beta-lyase [Hyphomicrobium sp.]